MEELVLADNEIDSVLLCHDKPEDEHDKEAMALIGKIGRSRRVKDVEFERKS